MLAHIVKPMPRLEKRRERCFRLGSRSNLGMERIRRITFPMINPEVPAWFIRERPSTILFSMKWRKVPSVLIGLMVVACTSPYDNNPERMSQDLAGTINMSMMPPAEAAARIAQGSQVEARTCATESDVLRSACLVAIPFRLIDPMCQNRNGCAKIKISSFLMADTVKREGLISIVKHPCSSVQKTTEPDLQSSIYIRLDCSRSTLAVTEIRSSMDSIEVHYNWL